MVLVGKTLSLADHRRATGERATPHALRRAGQAHRLAKTARGPGQHCRDRGPKPAQHYAPIFFEFSISFTFLENHVKFKNT
jgi:hypothetical protein